MHDNSIYSNKSLFIHIEMFVMILKRSSKPKPSWLQVLFDTYAFLPLRSCIFSFKVVTGSAGGGSAVWSILHSWKNLSFKLWLRKFVTKTCLGKQKRVFESELSLGLTTESRPKIPLQKPSAVAQKVPTVLLHNKFSYILWKSWYFSN